MGDKLALVTGSSSGIGRSVAEQLLQRGWRVVGVARRDVDIAHEAYHHVRLDLAELDAVTDYFENRFAAESGLSGATRVGLVNNAGLLEPVAPLHKASADALRRAYLVNAVAPQWLMGYFLRAAPPVPLRIVNVSSGAATNAYPGWGAYCATKAALRMAGEVVGTEAELYAAEGRRDVALVSYSPGVVDTDMQGLIRTKSAEDFPNVERFIGLHEKGQLVPVDKPSAEICDMLEADGLPMTDERRYGG